MGQDDFRIAFDPIGVAPSGVEPGGTAHHPANLVQQLAGDLLRDGCTGLGGFDQEKVESGNHLSHRPEPGEPLVLNQSLEQLGGADGSPFLLELVALRGNQSLMQPGKKMADDRKSVSEGLGPKLRHVPPFTRGSSTHAFVSRSVSETQDQLRKF
jgi:hypothetical protein